ncbi:MAG: 3-deoxy-D-manno-octulosonate 8-phosphate phosphatase [Paludibacteraceae bacterium]|nr:3-deoxy-D-manno-octulosonate 8-phosphate phosphatase [Paludibacteraceae bacterium]
MIRFFVMDVDGTLTDGKIYMGPKGEVCKAFDIKDGCGIKILLPQHNIVPVIITARNSEIVQNRCEELGITDCYQGVYNKLLFLEDVLLKYSKKDGQEYTCANVVYVGDDLPDIPCMKKVQEDGGIAACPADAAKEILEIADIISTKNAGDGAVREIIERIIAQQ